jgi:hypothetical protein
MFHSRSAATVAVLLCVAMAAAACGKRGAPLAPFVRVPAALTQVTAARVGNEVYVTVTVPAENIDASIPGDVGRVDIYAYSGRVMPPLARFAEVARVVASIPVAPPPLPDMPVPTPAPGFVDPAGAWQGTMVTVRDTLTDEEFVQGPELTVDPRRARTALSAAPVVAPTGGLKRFYVAIPFSTRGRPGPPSAAAEFALTALPDPPAAVRASYTDAGVSLVWEPSGGLIGFILDQPLAPEPAPFDAPIINVVPIAGVPLSVPADPAVPPGPTTYNVYRDLAPDPLAVPGTIATPEWSAPPPLPVNASPLPALAATDEIEFGRPRCYTVRALRGVAPAVVMSEPSAPVCVTPIDIFAPAVPTGLAAVPSEGGISLIWEPNLELDLGGYLILRREGSDATLRQLTDAPIVDARFRDTDVKPGTRYTYSVVAVDAQLPLPNMSGESERVEEIAR